MDAEEQGASLLRLVSGTLARAKGVVTSPCHFSWLESCAAYRALTRAAAESLANEGRQRKGEASRAAAVAAENALEVERERERESVAADKARVAA